MLYRTDDKLRQQTGDTQTEYFTAKIITEFYTVEKQILPLLPFHSAYALFIHPTHRNVP